MPQKLYIDLESIDLCRCSANVVVGLFESNPGLLVLNAVAIKGEHLDMNNLCKLTELRELRLRSLSSLTFSNFKSLEGLIHLTHLSLTSVNLSETDNLHVIGKLVNLESLELGECSKLTTLFAVSLKWLQQLEKLRLEKGTDHCCTFDILDVIATLPRLTQLELVNFDIKPDFDIHLKRCRNIRRLLIIPTYISQSATTNNVILSEKAEDDDIARYYVGVNILAAILERIQLDTGLIASGSIGATNMIARLACPINKPQGITVVTANGLDQLFTLVKIEETPGLKGITGQKILNKWKKPDGTRLESLLDFKEHVPFTQACNA